MTGNSRSSHDVRKASIAAVQRVVAGPATQDVLAVIADKRVVERVAVAGEIGRAKKLQPLDIGCNNPVDFGTHRVGAFTGKFDCSITVDTTYVSLPALPSRMLFPEFPSNTLSRALPVPLLTLASGPASTSSESTRQRQNGRLRSRCPGHAKLTWKAGVRSVRL
ncbi:hypothetical protein WBQ96_02815 [Mesorhizobium sp. CCNWLY176]